MLSLLKIISFLVGHIPRTLTVLLGRLFGTLAYRLDKKRKKITIENITKAFGNEKRPEEIERIARGTFKNLAINALEFMRLPWLKPVDLDGYIDYVGLENLKRALAKKKGVIFCAAHFGNWELLAQFYALMGFPLDLVVRELDSPLMEEFVRWVRVSHGNRVVSKKRSMRRLLKTLKDNGCVGIMMDQNVAHVEGVFVDFFGTPACTNKGPAILAAASGASVLPTFILRAGNTHRVIIGEEITLDCAGDKELDAVKNTAAFTRAIEDMIRKYPEQWFWVHRRWKTRPPADAGERP